MDIVYGGVSRGKRDLIFHRFQSGKGPRHIIVAHPECMAHGLTLTTGNLIVWYGPAPDLETYDQANARIIRPGQTFKTMIVHLFGTPVEKAAYARLRTRSRMQGLLLELFRNQEVTV